MIGWRWGRRAGSGLTREASSRVVVQTTSTCDSARPCPGGRVVYLRRSEARSRECAPVAVAG
ncbi:hypothetical protein JB92DRAFT_2896130 [Gautieria morchelliformis]|nr:hypothetical protein JB92DRAFT_2896130 [Gautieria morchelliformis]